MPLKGTFSPKILQFSPHTTERLAVSGGKKNTQGVFFSIPLPSFLLCFHHSTLGHSLPETSWLYYPPLFRICLQLMKRKWGVKLSRKNPPCISAGAQVHTREYFSPRTVRNYDIGSTQPYANSRGATSFSWHTDCWPSKHKVRNLAWISNLAPGTQIGLRYACHWRISCCKLRPWCHHWVTLGHLLLHWVRTIPIIKCTNCKTNM